MSTTATTEEQLKKMYEGQLTSQKEQLKQDYTQADANLTAQKENLQKVTDENLRRTAVDAQIAAMNNEEYYAASGLSSGAKAQARLSLDNQARANMTAIRTAQQEADAELERQRSILSQEYASAIRKAQADNDLALAQALYAEAEKAEAQLLAKQEAAANLMAQTGDYSRVGALYGLTDAEIQTLNGTTGTSSTGNSGGGGTVNNGSLKKSQVEELQRALNAKGANLTVDGLYGKNTAAAAGGLSAAEAYAKYVTSYAPSDGYNTVLNRYIAAKKDGQSQLVLDNILRECIAEKHITSDEADEIRNYRY